MAFIRTKRLKGRDYAYLVESVWNPVKKASRQRTIKYLGPAARVKLEDIPEGYRDDKVNAFILQNSALAARQRARLIGHLKEDLLAAVLDGNVPRSKVVSGKGLKALGLDQLYAHVVTPVMYAVGEMWERREIYVSHEHLATNTMAQAVSDINAKTSWTGKKRGTAIVCTPDGERHKFVAQVIRGLLLNRGFDALDISDSAPTDSIVAFAEFRRPEVVIVSVTMSQHLSMAKRLIVAIREALPDARIAVGGQGIAGEEIVGLPSGVLVNGADTLGFLDSLVGSVGQNRI